MMIGFHQRTKVLMQIGRLLLTALSVTTAAGTAAADLSRLHARNPRWPPHARLHAIWNVTHVTATQSLALALLWTGAREDSPLRARIAALLVLSFAVSFFGAALIAPAFGAAITPDVPAEDMPPRPLGLDGNLFSFLAATPLMLLGWRLCENRTLWRPFRVANMARADQ
jgi:hypothetical protein